MSVALGAQIVLSAILVAAAVWFVTERETAYAFLGLGSPEPKRTAPSVDPSVPVIVAEVAGRTDDVELRAVGTGTARRSVTLQAEVAGQVEQLMFDAGTAVVAGAPLLVLDDREERLALELAEVQLADAMRNVERLSRLRERGSTPVVTLEDAQTAAEVARIERDRAAEALAKRTVRAPFTGVTGIQQVDVGARIDEQSPITNLDDRSTLRVEFDVPEEYISRLEVGTEVAASTPAFPDRQFDGRIDEIDSRIDPLSRTARVRAEIDNDDDLLRPGMSFVVTALLPGKKRAAIPQLSLQWDREGAYVWRIVEGKAERVHVRLIRRTAGKALVEGGLEPGDIVVVEGVQRLRVGRPVKAVGGGAEEGMRS